VSARRGRVDERCGRGRIQRRVGERTKIKGQRDALKYGWPAGFTTVYVVASKGEAVPSPGLKPGQ
jgi:hypothetical protein